jgi:hypothetical protein
MPPLCRFARRIALEGQIAELVQGKVVGTVWDEGVAAAVFSHLHTLPKPIEELRQEQFG